MFVTDYPFTILGDKPLEPAPFRPVIVRDYDGDKYVEIDVLDDKGNVLSQESIKRAYVLKNGEPLTHQEAMSIKAVQEASELLGLD